MANHKSALKRVRQTERRRVRNRLIITSMRTSIKRVREALAEGKAAEANENLQQAVRELTRAAQKGVIHQSQANRKISRLVRAVNAAQ